MNDKSRIIENETDFIEMSNLMTYDKQELNLRNMVYTMVQPIIDLAKKNIEHNAKKNERFTEINVKIESN